MVLRNPGWVGYFDRSYEQIKANVLTKFQSLVPEITDHTETNPWVKGISIWAALIEMLGYYIDATARERFLSTAQEFASAVKIAKSYDYRVKGATPATATLRFTSSIPATGNIVIPIGTRVQTNDGIVYMTTTSGTILTGATSVQVESKQWDQVTGVLLGTSNGNPNQVFALEENVADMSVIAYVNAIAWQAQDTFVFSLPASEHFVQAIDEDTKMYIYFSDNVNGKIPPSGQAITVDYKVTLGVDGQVGAGLINTINSTIVVPGAEVLSVTNDASANGAASFEDLTKLQKRIPLSIRTKYRGVTKPDFIDLAELVAGVERAGVSFNCDTDDIVHVYIVPEGGGVATPTLISAVQVFIDERKILSLKVKAERAGVIDIILTINVVAYPGFSNSVVASDVKDALVDLFEPENQAIGGIIVVGNLYEVIEAVSGVSYSDITIISIRPYAKNLVTPTNVLNWTRTQLPGSAFTIKWLIRFLTVSNYELYKSGVFLGQFTVNTLHSYPEIEFQINGNHVSGDNYEFYTYPYNKNVLQLVEQSIPSINISDITVNVTGGV